MMQDILAKYVFVRNNLMLKRLTETIIAMSPSDNLMGFMPPPPLILVLKFRVYETVHAFWGDMD